MTLPETSESYEESLSRCRDLTPDGVLEPRRLLGLSVEMRRCEMGVGSKGVEIRTQESLVPPESRLLLMWFHGQPDPEKWDFLHITLLIWIAVFWWLPTSYLGHQGHHFLSVVNQRWDHKHPTKTFRDCCFKIVKIVLKFGGFLVHWHGVKTYYKLPNSRRLRNTILWLVARAKLLGNGACSEKRRIFWFFIPNCIVKSKLNP